MWYKQVLAQFGGGVNWPDENTSQENTYQQTEPEIDEIKDVDSMPDGLYDELPGILEKMGITLKEYYKMTEDQQKEIWDILVYRPHRMNLDDNGNFVVSPQAASTEARRHSPVHTNPEETPLELQLQGSQQQNNNVDPQSMASREKGNGSQYFKNGEGYYQASKGKQDPILFGNKPSNQTWY